MEYDVGAVLFSDGKTQDAEKLDLKKHRNLRDGTEGSSCPALEKLDLKKHRNLRAYDGRMTKYGVTYQGVDYIAKYSKNLSCVCEHVASSFINHLGFEAHRTRLVDTVDGLCVLVEDFCNTLGELRPYIDTKQSSEDSDLSDKEYSYEDVVYLIKKHKKIPEELKQKAVWSFWEMFFLDAILANRDRHKGNWGYIKTSDGYIAAPLYDNGACLFPDVGKHFAEYQSDRFGFVKERSEAFPACLLKDYEGGRLKRTNYYRFINESNLSKYSEMAFVYGKFRELPVDFVRSSIESATDNELIGADLRQFYIDLVMSRFGHIILREPL